MSSLGDLTHWVARQIRGVFDALARMADSRDQLMLFANATGTPIIVDTEQVAALRTIARGEATAQLIQDSLEVIEGLRDAVHRYIELTQPDLSATQEADLAAELWLRSVLPVLRWWYHHTHQLGASVTLELIGLLDDKIAEANPGFTLTRVLALLTEGQAAALEGQQVRLLLPMLAPIAEFALQKWKTFKPHYHQVLNGGWESADLDRAYGRPQPWRDTPTWMAQRTTSLHIIKQKSFTLDRYTNPTPTPEPTFVWGVTLVPVPQQRAWTGDPAHAPAIADTKGPATWLQVDLAGDKDVDLGDGWSVHVRGFGDVGGEIPLADRADVGDLAGAGGGVEVELQWTAAPKPPPPPETPTTPSDIDQEGDFGGASVELDKISFIGFAAGGVSLDDAGGDLGIAIKISKLHVAITPKSEVLGALVKRNLSFTTDLGFEVSNKGIAFTGANGLDLYINTRLSLPGVTLTYLRISGIYDKKPLHVQIGQREYDVETTEIGAQITAGVEIGYSKLKLILDGIGAKALVQTRRPDGNLLGLGHVSGDVVLPSGIGLRADFGGAVQGGGFFSHDATLERYAGAIEFGFGSVPATGKPKFVLRGVGFTEPRPAVNGETDGATTTLGLLTGEFGSWGLGALAATHRGVDLDAIVAGLPTGALDALLFPQDPLGKTAQIVNALATMFPPAAVNADKHVLGLLGKYSWAGGLASFSLGVIAEFSGAWASWPTKIAVPFSLKFGKEGKLRSLFWIEIDGIGDYDFGIDSFELRGVLRNSRVFGADFVGGAVVFYGDPDDSDADKSSAWFVSAGGYHPSYYGGKGPARASVDKRVGIVLSRGNVVKLELSIYAAKSPAGYQWGFTGHLYVGAAGFAFDGKVWLDALVHSLDRWVIDLGGSIALILFGETVTELKLEGEWSRTDKVYFAGEVSFKILWWSVTKHTEREMTTELGTEEQAVDVHTAVAKTLTDPQSYPNTLPGEVSLTNVARAGIWNAPEQPLAFVQKVAPLDTQIERIDATVLQPAVTLATGPVTISGHERSKTPALSEFTPAAFLELDTDAALHAPCGELWPAGFTAGDECAAGEDQPAVAQFDEITIDRAQLAPKRRRFQLSGLVLSAWNAPSPVTLATPIRVLPASFASRIGDAPSSFAKAWMVRGTTLRRTEGTP